MYSYRASGPHNLLAILLASYLIYMALYSFTLIKEEYVSLGLVSNTNTSSHVRMSIAYSDRYPRVTILSGCVTLKDAYVITYFHSRKHPSEIMIRTNLLPISTPSFIENLSFSLEYRESSSQVPNVQMDNGNVEQTNSIIMICIIFLSLLSLIQQAIVHKHLKASPETHD
uniref:Uncharacterized protein n=1 Tax=Glossina austeni TaxID=7395 RepID=A0A1A9VB13_GLOAU